MRQDATLVAAGAGITRNEDRLELVKLSNLINSLTMKPTSFLFNRSSPNNRCEGLFLHEVRQITLLALVFSLAVMLTTGCSSTGKGFSAKLISPVTNSVKDTALGDDGFYYPARSPVFDDLTGG